MIRNLINDEWGLVWGKVLSNQTNQQNIASQKVMEKAVFQKEGIIRKDTFIRGAWQDGIPYSILREEWKEPKILTRTT